MKTWLHAMAMCQSMFCAIPCPWNIWDEDAKDRMLMFLPMVGLEIGLIWALLAWAIQLLTLPGWINGVVLCAYPFLVTGYMHLDGFMDVTDAVKSWRDLVRRREILKDSHVGSFAVISCVLLLLAQFACFAAADHSMPWILVLVPMVSRCGSALAISTLKPMSSSQYVDRKTSGRRIAAVLAMLVLALTAGFVFCGTHGFVLVGSLIGYALALRRGYRSLEGVNGDIAGYALCYAELCAAAVYALL